MRGAWLRRFVVDPPDLEGDQAIFSVARTYVPVLQVFLQMLAVRSETREEHLEVVVAPELSVSPADARLRVEIWLGTGERIDLAAILGTAVHDETPVFIWGLRREHRPALVEPQAIYDGRQRHGLLDGGQAAPRPIVVQHQLDHHHHDGDTNGDLARGGPPPLGQLQPASLRVIRRDLERRRRDLTRRDAAAAE